MGVFGYAGALVTGPPVNSPRLGLNAGEAKRSTSANAEFGKANASAAATNEYTRMPSSPDNLKLGEEPALLQPAYNVNFNEMEVIAL